LSCGVALFIGRPFLVIVMAMTYGRTNEPRCGTVRRTHNDMRL